MERRAARILLGRAACSDPLHGYGRHVTITRGPLSRPAPAAASSAGRSRRATSARRPTPTEPRAGRLLAAELTSPLEAARLIAAGPRLRSMPRGDGHVVVDIPGWRAPEVSGLPLRRYLAWLGYDAHGWGLGTNLATRAGRPRLLTATVEELARAADGRARSSGGAWAGSSRARWRGAGRTWSAGWSPTARRWWGAGPTPHLPRPPGPPGGSTADRPVRVPLTADLQPARRIVSWRACLDHATPGRRARRGVAPPTSAWVWTLTCGPSSRSAWTQPAPEARAAASSVRDLRPSFA